MAEKPGITKKDQSFTAKWEKQRQKGKFFYVLTRGLLLGSCLFAIWFGITYLEIMRSEFERAIFTWESFLQRSLIWLVVEMTIGFVLAHGFWKKREEQYHYLS